MAFEKLSANEQEQILQCMKTIASGSEIEDAEFFTRLGTTRAVLQKIILDGPNIDDSSEDSEGFLAINNCLNEICNGLDIPESRWSDYFAVSKVAYKQTYLKWLKRTAFPQGGIR